MKKKLSLFMLLLLSIANYAQDISYTFENPRNTNDGVDDFYEVDIYASSTTEFKMGDVQLRFFYNTTAFGEAVEDNGVLESLTPTGTLFGSALFGGAVPQFAIVNIANTLDSFTITYEAKVSDGTFTENTITATPTHLFSIKLKYVDATEEPDVTFSTEAADQDQVFTACGPFDASAFTNADCIGFPGDQLSLADITFDSAGAALVSSIEWLGVTSSDWNTATNWVGDVVPSSTDDVEIVSAINSPEIDNEIIEVNNLTIDTGATLTVTGFGALEVAGDLTVDGSLLMSVSSTSSLTGTSLIVEGTATGNITYELTEFIADEFTLISSPVSGQVRSDFMTAGSTDILINTTPDPDRYALGTYNDANADGAKWDYFDADDLSDTTSELGTAAGYSFAKASAGSILFTGTPVTTSVEKAVTADEFNLVGNPYTAFLPINGNGDSNFINDNLSKMDPSFVGVYIWDTEQQKYVANTLTSGTANITPGKGFFVHTTTGVATLSFDAAKRVESPAFLVLKTSNTTPKIELLATSNGTTVTTAIQYFDFATKGLDPGYDVGNFSGASFDVYTKLLDDANGKDFTLQSLPLESEETTSIPVGLVAKAGSTVRFSIAKDNLDTAIYLEDTLLNVVTKLDETAYEVTVNEDVNGSGRFFLKTEASKILAVDDADISSIKVYTSSEALVVKGIIEGEFNVQLFNVLGKEVFKAKETGIGNNTLTLPSLQAGVYLVKVNSSLGTTNSKIIIK